MRIRPRRDEDLPRLLEVMVAQRPGSGYPVQPPSLGMIVRARELGAWVAELDGVVVGHVSATVLPTELDADQQAFADACVAALGCDLDQLGVVSALFVDDAARGRGVGRALMTHVTHDIVAAGRRPCLDVVSIHSHGRRLYEQLGWRVAAELWPAWLPAELGPDLAMVLPETAPRG